MTRATLYVLLPPSVIAGLVLCAQGIPQTLQMREQAATLEGATHAVAIGPVASQSRSS